MRFVRLNVLGALLAGLAVLALSVPAAAAGAAKVPLLHDPFGSCNIGAIAGSDTDAFAVINGPDNKVQAEVSIKDGDPNGTYSVSLVQTPSGENCFANEATLRTNKQGNGNVHLSEARLPGTTGAFVFVTEIGGSFDFRATRNVPL